MQTVMAMLRLDYGSMKLLCSTSMLDYWWEVI